MLYLTKLMVVSSSVSYTELILKMSFERRPLFLQKLILLETVEFD